MKKYNVHDAKTNLSKILNEVAQGEVVYIARAGKVIAEIRAVNEKISRAFKLGALQGKGWLAHDWNSEEVNREVADSFYENKLEGPTDQ